MGQRWDFRNKWGQKVGTIRPSVPSSRSGLAIAALIAMFILAFVLLKPILIPQQVIHPSRPLVILSADEAHATGNATLTHWSKDPTADPQRRAEWLLHPGASVTFPIYNVPIDGTYQVGLITGELVLRPNELWYREYVGHGLRDIVRGGMTFLVNDQKVQIDHYATIGFLDKDQPGSGAEIPKIQLHKGMDTLTIVNDVTASYDLRIIAIGVQSD